MIARARLIIRWLLPAAVIVGAGVWIYLPALYGGWLWDDALYVTGNALLRSADGLRKIWCAPPGMNYFPVTESVQWIQWHLWHERTLGYHLTNLGLHLLSAGLFWRLLDRLGVRLAWLGGLLLAIHPVAVESVAWISELKNTLSLPPLLLAMTAYVGYCDREAGGEKARSVIAYAASLFFFTVAMLCKSTVAMFPAVVLLYAWWRHGRIRKTDLASSAPFFLVAAVLGLVTVWFEAHRVIAPLGFSPDGATARLAAAGRAIVFYFGHILFPVALMPMYPRWVVTPPAPGLFWPWLLIAAALGWLWTYRSAWGRHVLLGVGFFALNLAPVLGVVPMAYSRISWVADHLAYVPLLGLIGLASAGIGEVLSSGGTRRRLALAVAAAALATVLAAESRRYAGEFRDEEELWTYTLRRNPGAWMARYNLGNALRESGRVAEAIPHYEEALRLRADYPEAENNLGLSLELTGRPRVARAHYERALRLKPDLAEARYNLGDLLLKEGKAQEALPHLERAVELKPDFSEGWNNLGLARWQAGRRPEALDAYEHALRLKPDLVEAENNLGNDLRESGRPAEAVGHLERALRLKPDYAEAESNLADALDDSGRCSEAISHYEHAIKLKPGLAQAHNNLGVVLARSGRLAESVGHFEEALRLDPAYADARRNLDLVRNVLRGR